MLQFLRRSSFFETGFFMIYFLFKWITCSDARVNKNEKLIKRVSVCTKEKNLSELKIALISDELTYKNFSHVCNVYPLTPNNWKMIFNQNEIDLFLCESAWNGCEAHRQCWRGRIYKNHKVKFETRKVLFEILKHCENNDIPTAFWNKEDPTFFESTKSDFVDTALKFQHIFTTEQSCVQHYKAKGHTNVDVMMFGFSPQLYNPLQPVEKKEKQAVFAGSWFAEEAQRCTDMESLFQKILNEKIPLVIYDRHSESRKSNRHYPDKYLPYVQGALPQEKLGAVIKKSQFAINVNTATETQTMFARRVYELMASNVYIISNRSSAMERQLAGRYCTPEDVIPSDVKAICRENVDYVFQNHTNEFRLKKMFLTIGYPLKQEKITIAVCTPANKETEVFVSDAIDVDIVNDLSEVDSQKHQYFFIQKDSTFEQIKKMLPHCSYLPEQCGVRIADEQLYQIVTDDQNSDVLFPVAVIDSLKNNLEFETTKYNI